jgi:hypothetical protein
VADHKTRVWAARPENDGGDLLRSRKSSNRMVFSRSLSWLPVRWSTCPRPSASRLPGHTACGFLWRHICRVVVGLIVHEDPPVVVRARVRRSSIQRSMLQLSAKPSLATRNIRRFAIAGALPRLGPDRPRPAGRTSKLLFPSCTLSVFSDVSVPRLNQFEERRSIRHRGLVFSRDPARPSAFLRKKSMPACQSLLRNSVARLLKHPAKMQSAFGTTRANRLRVLLRRFPSAAKNGIGFSPWGTPMPRNRRRHQLSIVQWNKQKF